jgi:hypothetical protein
LNSSDSEKYFTAQEQKAFLYNIFKSINKYRIKDFEIIDLEKENRELSKILREKPDKSEFMPIDMLLMNFSKKVSSKLIFDLLLWFSRDNEEFEKLMESPKPANENAHRLYALCEISIRLADIMN